MTQPHTCHFPNCTQTFDTMEAFVDHLTDDHDAFTRVVQGEIP